MKNLVLFIALLLCITTRQCLSETHGFLANIINKSPYQIRIQTTDKSASIINKNGQTLNGDQIQNKPFFLKDIKSFNFTIPWGNWEGQARIYIDSLRNAQDNNSLVSRSELLERDSNVELWTMQNGYDQNTQKLISNECRKFDTKYTLEINPDGTTKISSKQVDKKPNDVDWCDVRWSEVKAPSMYVGTCWPGSLLKQKDACADWCQGSFNNVEQWTCSQNKMYCICKDGIKPGSHNIFNKIADTAVTAGTAIKKGAEKAGTAIEDTAKKVGNLITGGIDKARNIAHSIRDAIRAAADTISSTPDTITQKAGKVLGDASNPDLAAQLQGGADKLGMQVRTIMATIDTIKKQKEDVIKQKLASKGLKELKELNALLISDAKTPGAFDDVIAALKELAGNGTMSVKQKNGTPISDALRVTDVAVDKDGAIIKDAVIKDGSVSKDGAIIKDAVIIPEGVINKDGAIIKDAIISDDCTEGTLCEIRTAFKAAISGAKKGEESIKANIKELDRQINHPTLIQDGVVESLPNRLRHLAKLLDI